MSQQNKIYVYSASWCSPCRYIKKELEQNYIEFEEIDCTTEEGRQKAVDNNIQAVPTVVIGEHRLMGSHEVTLFNIKRLLNGE